MKTEPIEIKVEDTLTKREFFVVWILLVVAHFICRDEKTKEEIKNIKTHIYLQSQ